MANCTLASKSIPFYNFLADELFLEIPPENFLFEQMLEQIDQLEQNENEG